MSPPPPERVVPIGDALREVLAKEGLEQHWRRHEILAVWPKLVGEQIARQTTPSQLRNGVLTVEVSHPAWLSELDRYHKQTILERLRARFPKDNIRSIRFHIAPGASAAGD